MLQSSKKDYNGHRSALLSEIDNDARSKTLFYSVLSQRDCIRVGFLFTNSAKPTALSFMHYAAHQFDIIRDYRPHRGTTPSQTVGPMDLCYPRAYLFPCGLGTGLKTGMAAVSSARSSARLWAWLKLST
jgi:hypothetical protein